MKLFTLFRVIRPLGLEFSEDIHDLVDHQDILHYVRQVTLHCQLALQESFGSVAPCGPLVSIVNSLR